VGLAMGSRFNDMQESKLLIEASLCLDLFRHIVNIDTQTEGESFCTKISIGSSVPVSLCIARCLSRIPLPLNNSVSLQTVYFCGTFHLLTHMESRDAKHIVIAGDSAGGGLCVALMIILRDQGLPMPAGASLISPWVDLTHSFPSITIPTEFDYVPVNGFHAKPNLSWPPPTSDEMRALGYKVNPDQEPDYVVEIDHQPHVLRDQFQMYAANSHLQIPLVSPICAASLGGEISHVNPRTVVPTEP